jgi:hypothetical protein
MSLCRHFELQLHSSSKMGRLRLFQGITQVLPQRAPQMRAEESMAAGGGLGRGGEYG